MLSIFNNLIGIMLKEIILRNIFSNFTYLFLRSLKVIIQAQRLNQLAQTIITSDHVSLYHFNNELEIKVFV